MSAYVVEGPEDIVFPQDEEEREIDYIESYVVTRFAESAAMRNVYPCLLIVSPKFSRI
jgi:hypothetical protein